MKSPSSPTALVAALHGVGHLGAVVVLAAVVGGSMAYAVQTDPAPQ